VRLGLALSILIPTYESSWLPAGGSLINHGSELCKGLLSGLNKQYDDFDHAERIRLLKRLLDFIEKAKIDFSQYKNMKREQIYEMINQLITQEEIAKKVPSIQARCAGIAVGYAAQYGINVLVTHFASEIVVPQVGCMIVGSVAGPLGIVSYGVAGMVIETQLGQLVQEHIIDKATALAYEYILNAIGTYIGQFAGPNIILTFELGAHSLSKLLGFYHDLKQEDQSFTQKVEWINVLHNLPNHLVDDKKKRILEKTQGTALGSMAGTQLKC